MVGLRGMSLDIVPIILLIIEWLRNKLSFIMIQHAFYCSMGKLATVFKTSLSNSFLSQSWKSPWQKTNFQIPKCVSPTSHNAPVCNKNVHMCTFLLRNGAFLDMCPVHHGICEMDLFQATLQGLSNISFNLVKDMVPIGHHQVLGYLPVQRWPVIILCMRPANERRRYIVTSSLNG